MTPSAAQLAALVPLDPTTLVLLTFALMPARWTSKALNPLMRRPWWLRAPVFALAALSFAMPVLPWPLIALINAYIFIEAFAIATGSQRPARRWGALLAVAAFWSLQTFRTFWQTFFEPDGRAHFWFVDFFNKLYLVVIGPLLVPIGGAEARGAVLGYLSEPVAFFSNHLLALHLFASLAAATLLTHVLTGRMNASRETPLEGPSLLSARMPAPIALALLGALLAHRLAPDQTLLIVLRELAGAALVWQGIAWAWVSSAGIRGARAAALALLIALALHPHLFGLLALIGAMDSLASLSARSLRDPTRRQRVSQQSAAAVRALRRGFGPTILVLTALPLLTFPMIPLSHMVLPAEADAPAADAPPAASEASPSVQVRQGRLPGFSIDRYEHPNRPGEGPTTGLSPQEAEARCAAEGKTLCESVAWYEACSDHGERFYVLPSYPYQASALARLRRECNLRDAEGSRGLLPAGQLARCRGAYGVADMAGNAYEWVRLEGLEGFWGLAGSYYGYSDAQTPACGFRVLVHAAQVDIIDLEATGFRCCR